MKKFLAMLLALTMVLSLSVTAFAANEATADADSENKATIDVTGKYEEEYIDADTVISVDVAWDSMEFTYAANGYQGEWNPGDHSYSGGNSGGWVKNTSDITVTNHSNAAVDASFTFTQDENVTDDITGTFGKDSVTLATAEETDYDDAPNATVTFTIGGTMSKAVTDNKLGVITVALEKANYLDLTEIELGDIDDDGTNETGAALTAAVTNYLNENGGSTLKLETSMYSTLSKGAVKAINAGIEASNVNSVGLVLKNVVYIDSYAFSYGKGSNITSIYAPDVSSIQSNAFAGASSITSFIFPNVTGIGTAAFIGCSGMTELTFGKMITSPGSQTFDNVPTENVTLTLSSEQKSGTWGNYYPATFGENGEWLSLTWKTILEYEG